MSHVRTAYREVIRAVDRHITSVTGNRLWRDFIAKEFRRRTANGDTESARELVQEARDYAFMVESVAAHKELLISYNIRSGIDTARQQQMVERTASRVGLKLPTHATKDEKS